MVNANTDALGIIFPNSYDSLVPEMTRERSVASIPFAGRYRMVDFILSGMVNGGMDNISLIVRKNYRSLLDHLGSGREWDLTRKRGGLNIIPPYAEREIKLYNGRVEALASIIGFLKDQKEKYVVMADANIALNFDFRAFIDAHVESGADVTVAYVKDSLKESDFVEDPFGEELCYTLDVEDGRVKEIRINSREEDERNYCLNIYIMSRELLIEAVEKAYIRGYACFERDILAPNLDTRDIRGFEFDGYVARIRNLKSYFDENMKLLDEKNLQALFGGNQIYTKIRDDFPTRYISGAKAKNVMVADGCIIEGEVENSILFRGVKVAKGAKVKNCVLMQDTVVEENASVEYVISDKKVTITEGKEMKGTDALPVYIAKRQTV